MTMVMQANFGCERLSCQIGSATRGCARLVQRIEMFTCLCPLRDTNDEQGLDISERGKV